jgi:hypothetical protein
MRAFEASHECETYELWQTLSALTAEQRRVVRSYVRRVEFGAMGVEEWLRDDPTAPAASTWRKAGGNYWGSEADPNSLFRKAVEEYTEAFGKWTLRAEARQVRVAGEILAGGLKSAARRLVTLVDEGENDRIRLDAAKNLLDRFKDTASQAPAASGDDSGLSDDERANRIAALLDAARARRSGQPDQDGPEGLETASGSASDGLREQSG